LRLPIAFISLQEDIVDVDTGLIGVCSIVKILIRMQLLCLIDQFLNGAILFMSIDVFLNEFSFALEITYFLSKLLKCLII